MVLIGIAQIGKPVAWNRFQPFARYAAGKHIAIASDRTNELVHLWEQICGSLRKNFSLSNWWASLVKI